jgi:hypothetical protein
MRTPGVGRAATFAAVHIASIISFLFALSLFLVSLIG